ncbi:MAG TPA: 30S ribosomal protein S3 [Candidatus Dormibacteraeota bacterium]|nr:30S ribosomal protein S3 [Candidatus Dormibacteraeota bacterium]
MGHKVHPNAFRLGVYRSWEANWFATNKDYTKLLHEDLAMRRLILGRLRNAGIAKIETERSSNAQMTITIRTAKPGIVIGKGGASVDQLRADLERTFGNRVRISIDEIKQPELDAQLVAENIASQLERRISHRRAMKQSILRTMRAGAKGVRIALGGRLRGAEMARRDSDREGRVPLHTLRADIQFARATAKTTFGMIGIKVWIYRDLVKGRTRGGELQTEIAPQPTAETVAAAQTAAQQGGPRGDGQRAGQRPRRRGGRSRGGGGGGHGQGGAGGPAAQATAGQGQGGGQHGQEGGGAPA